MYINVHAKLSNGDRKKLRPTVSTPGKIENWVKPLKCNPSICKFSHR